VTIPGFPPSPVPRDLPERKHRWWPWVALLVAVVFIGGVLVIRTNQPTPGFTSAGAPVVPDTDFQAPTPTAVQAAPTGPLTSFDDGTYEVGTKPGQVAPGRYKATGKGCHWARLKSTDEGDTIGTAHTGNGQTFMTVKASDAYVHVSGCIFTEA